MNSLTANSAAAATNRALKTWKTGTSFRLHTASPAHSRLRKWYTIRPARAKTTPTMASIPRQFSPVTS